MIGISAVAPSAISPLAAAGITGGAALAGGILGYIGQRKTNSANAALAQRQMDFQAEMSNTAYQRAMADMRAAGLNPMLAYAQGGASAPSGQTAQMQNANSSLQSGINEATAKAVNAVKTHQDIRYSDAQIHNLEIQNDKLEAEKGKTLMEDLLLKKDYQKVWASLKAETDARIEKALTEIEESKYKKDVEIPYRRRETLLKGKEELKAKSSEYKLRKHKANIEHEYFKAKQLLEMIQMGTGSAKDLLRLFNVPSTKK